LPRSRTLRALAAGSAGVVCSGSAVCATLAYTHPSHRTVRVTLLTAVPEVGAAARAAEPSAGLLAWRAPEPPRPPALPPRVVVDRVRIVQTTRYIRVRAASPGGATGSTGTAATPRTTAARHVTTPPQVKPTTKPTTWPTTTPATTTTTDHRSTPDGAPETTKPERNEAGRASRPISATTTEPHQEEPRRGDDG
jgi:hypothetical protein